MQKSRNYVLGLSERDEVVYGINTGFGALAETRVDHQDLERLQLNLLRSHCTGVGKPLGRELTRAMIFIRVHCLIQGPSGINPDLVERFLQFLELDLLPVIPSKGSVGASGDLAPLAHMALPLIGEGEVIFKGKRQKSITALKECALAPLALGPKDGLALINGTAFMAAMGCVGLARAKNLIQTSDLACALTCEALRGTSKAYDSRIHAIRPHPGQVASAKNLSLLLKDSEIASSHKDCGKVQDPYSLRCAPQVHGAVRSVASYLEQTLSVEINSVTDNPLVFPEDQDILSGGNFHGEILALGLDSLCLGVAELGSISERRIEKMINPVFSKLPPFLAKESGLNSGLMIAHVTAASLVSESKVLSHPASVDSIPTSNDQEDHVSMGATSGLKLQTVLDNTQWILAIELLCAAQGIELLRPLKSSRSLECLHELIRSVVPPLEEDRFMAEDIEKLSQVIAQGGMIERIQGELQESLQ